MAATNKCLAHSNKSPGGGKPTKPQRQFDLPERVRFRVHPNTPGLQPGPHNGVKPWAFVFANASRSDDGFTSTFRQPASAYQ